jgi:hypothetical protein
MGKVEVLVDAARRVLNEIEDDFDQKKFDRYLELDKKLDAALTRDVTKEEFDEYWELKWDVSRWLEARKESKVFLEMAERVAVEGKIAFVFDDKTFGAENPKETYRGGGWNPSDCYDEDGFINDLLDCYDVTKE